MKIRKVIIIFQIMYFLLYYSCLIDISLVFFTVFSISENLVYCLKEYIFYYLNKEIFLAYFNIWFINNCSIFFPLSLVII